MVVIRGKGVGAGWRGSHLYIRDASNKAVSTSKMPTNRGACLRQGRIKERLVYYTVVFLMEGVGRSRGGKRQGNLRGQEARKTVAPSV